MLRVRVDRVVFLAVVAALLGVVALWGVSVTAASAPTFAGSDVSGDTKQSWGVVVADVNGDTKPDVVFANSGSVNRVCLGDGSGGFTCSDVSGDTKQSRGVVVADFNGDTNLMSSSPTAG